MAVTIKTKTGVSAADVLAQYQKSHGEAIGSFGGIQGEVARIPTGIFAFDMATGGGIPRGRCTIVYGPESSGKTNLALLAIRADQRMNPHMKQVFIAIEPFDATWAKKIGVDTDRVLVLYPSFAEEVADLAENMLYAEDVSIVVVDSLAAMISQPEAEKSAEGNTMGGTSNPIGKLVRRTTLALREAEKAGRDPALIYINQTRIKIGVMFGDPETMPGGNAPKFQAALWVRVYGKNVKDPKITDKYAVRKDTKFVIKKNKCPIIADSGEFELVVYPHNNLRIGDTDDWTLVKEYLEVYGMWTKLDGSKGYEIAGGIYPTQSTFKDRLYMDRAFGAEVRTALIAKTLEEKEGQLIVQNDPKLDGVGVDENGEILTSQAAGEAKIAEQKALMAAAKAIPPKPPAPKAGKKLSFAKKKL